MTRILLISYYWPPAGGGGVQRWLKMSKYIADLPDVELLVYTPENGEVPVVDESLISEVDARIKVIKTPIWEPYSWYKRFTGRKKDEKVYSGFISDKKESWMQKLAVFIRGNLFIPDARMFWIKPSVKFLSAYLKDHPVDVVISTGPPHSMHRIALGLKKRLNIRWIADFRDPWTNIDFYHQLRLTRWGDRRHHRMEAEVLQHADRIVTVSPSWAKDFKRLCGRDDIEVINNGYDPADFKGDAVPPEHTFTICHIGSMNKDRNVPGLWKALAELKEEGSMDTFRIKLVGQVDHAVLLAIQTAGLLEHLDHIPFKSHADVMDDLLSASILLLPVNDTPNSAGVVPGKLYEYMGAQRPILVIGPPTGDSATIVIKSDAGAVHGYDDVSGIKNSLLLWQKSHRQGTLKQSSSDVEQYSRKALAEKYLALIDRMIP